MRSTHTSVALALIVTAFAEVRVAHAQQTQAPQAIIESLIQRFPLFETWRESTGATFAFPSRTVSVKDLDQLGN